MFNVTKNIFYLLPLFLLMMISPLHSQQPIILIEDMQVNENVGFGKHYDPHMAMNEDGSFIVVWHDLRNIDADIYLQRFDNNASRIGDDILVNEKEGNENQTNPEVALANDGSFVVTWIDHRFEKAEIYAEQFDPQGNHLEDNFSVNEGRGELSDNSYPSISVSHDGNFIITWLENRNNEFGIYAKLFNNNGDVIKNTFKANEQFNRVDQYTVPDVGMDKYGNFIVVWSGLGWSIQRDIYAQRFDFEGNRLNDNFIVNDDNSDRYHDSPSISVFPGGNFVIAWIYERNNYLDIFAQRYDSCGTPIANNFMVNDQAYGQQFTPIVSTSSMGNFVITWKDEREGNVNFDIFSQIYDENGNPIGQNIKIHDDENSMYYLTPPTSAMDSSGNFIIAWNEGPIAICQIYAQQLDPNGNIIVPTFQVNADEGTANQNNPDICSSDNGDFYVVWEDYRNGTPDIFLQRYTRNGMLSGVNHQVNDFIDDKSQGSPQIGCDANGNLFIVWHEGKDLIFHVYGQRFNSDGQPMGNNFRISTDDTLYLFKGFPKIAMNQNGTSIIVWIREDMSGGLVGLYAQRFDSNGSALGSIFQVNDDNLLIPALAGLMKNGFAVGTDNSNNFVISFLEYRNDIRGISFKTYNSDGIPIGNIGQVRIDNPFTVFRYSMCMGSNGNFIMSWINSINASPANIFAQMYNLNGSVQGPNFLINDSPGSVFRRDAPTLSMDANGEFCVAWQDIRNGNDDIYGQMYSENGQPIQNNFKINSDSVISDQKNPATYFKNGKMYTVWEDNRIPGQGWDIFTNVILLGDTISNAINDIDIHPESYTLHQNYPNPFNPSTKIKFTLPKRENVIIEIFNLLGQKVKTLQNKSIAAGSHEVEFIAKDLSSGVYLYRIEAGDFHETKKMILLK